jgi:hypothetical protein
MSTDPTPDGVAAARADATDHLVPRTVRPIDIEPDDEDNGPWCGAGQP